MGGEEGEREGGRNPPGCKQSQGEQTLSFIHDSFIQPIFDDTICRALFHLARKKDHFEHVIMCLTNFGQGECLMRSG